MVNNSKFQAAVLEDAGSVKEREDVDSIDIIDNIRYFQLSAIV